ncbi:MAG: enoyl-CoA hydratase/isomerase family protein [Acidimicrobiia bacterium]|nr:enoyl-CoA hydratase/isomerase family protein [Acidimicrobiia bacterium]MYG93206.1 enoyl-CoA hydratase/isomerase family protein [Acidimicrobiia bacterium]
MPELSLTRHDGVARVTIDRPQRKHAWSAPMWAEMADLMGKCAEDDSVRVVLVTSTGDRVFSAGADLEQFGGADTAAVRASVEGVESVMASIEACPKPVVAVVSGAAVGAGTEVAAACDIRIASDRAWFSIPAAILGIVITRSDIARLVRGVGASIARDMLLTGRRLTAVEAQQIGFVRSIHSCDQLDAAAMDLATEIAALDGPALAAMKAHLNTLGDVAWNEESWTSTLEAITSAATQKRIAARLGDA